MLSIMLYLLIGAIAGLSSGLFGLGGGVVVVPALIYVFSYIILPTNLVAHMAVGTSLAIMIFTTGSSIAAHNRKGAVLWELVKKMLLGLIIGAVAGAILAYAISSASLEIIFAIFLLCISLRILFGGQPLNGKKNPLSKTKLALFSLFTGLFAGLLGVGAGSLSVPFLNQHQIKIQNAIGTANACSFPIALVGAISYMISGDYATTHIAWSTGFIYWPAFICIVLASLAFAQVGAAISHRLPAKILKKSFAICLLLIAIDMLT